MSHKSYFNLISPFVKIIKKSLSFFSFKKNVKSQVANYDELLIQSLRGRRLPNLIQLKYINNYLNTTEKKVLVIFSLVFLFSGSFLAYRTYSKNLEIVPVQGGEYIEALIGSPKYINPLYSVINQTDSDLQKLIYSSILKNNSDGVLVNDLAESIELSPDEKNYTVHIKKNILWHNGSPLTASDILFTFNAIKDPEYKSPLRDSYQGVSAEVKDDNTIIFKLKEPYAGFDNLLTFGIMPQDLWGQLTPNAASLADLNLKPIGSGPYKFKSLIKDKNGNLKSFTLVANSDYYLGRPLIDTLAIEFQPSYEEALAGLNGGSIDGLGFFPTQFSGAQFDKGFLNYQKLGSPQIKSLFLNTKSDFLSDVNLRRAVAFAMNKDSLIGDIANISPIDAFILPQSKYYFSGYKKYNYNLDEAKKMIELSGWKLTDVTTEDVSKADELMKSGDKKKELLGQSYKALGSGRWYYKDGRFLIIKLSTADSLNNAVLAEAIAKNLEQARIKVSIEVVPPAQVQNDLIKPRDYDILLTGLILSADPDPYLYWHSSQLGTDGLNLANYSNKEVDKLLEEGRTVTNEARRKVIYQKFLTLMADQEPAIYLYASNYVYIQNRKVKNNNSTFIYSVSDRFANIKDWYVKTGTHFKW